jgi:hypothetical protein
MICVALALALSGCDNMPPKSLLPAKAVPDWVLSTPADSREWYWGVGEGPQLDTAKRAALKDIAAKLRVSISGQLTSQVSVTNNSVDRQAYSRIIEEVQKTEFSHYVVEKTARSDNGFFVLVKVDRLAFVRDQQQKLGALESVLQQATHDLASKTALERFVTLHGLRSDLEQAVGYAQLLIAAEPDARHAARLRNLEDLQQQLRLAPGQLVLRIQARPDDADLANAVSSHLNDFGIRTGQAGAGVGNILNIASSSRSDSLYGSKLLKLNTTLSLLDDQGRVLASRAYETAGASTYDFRGARQNAIVKLRAALREAGPVQSLGFNE